MLDSTFAFGVSFNCEEHEAFRWFGASDGKTATLIANAKGLVYSDHGSDKYNLFRDVQKCWFWAIPADFTDRLTRTRRIKPETTEKEPSLNRLAATAA
jgi:hypothetical protein